jgi:hypothetical protein
VVIGGRAFVVVGALLFPPNGLWNKKPGECYRALTCAARSVHNKSREGDATPKDALDADQTDEELAPKIDSVWNSRDAVRAMLFVGATRIR